MRIVIVLFFSLIFISSAALSEVLIPGWWDASVDDLLIAREWLISKKAGVPETNTHILFEDWLKSDEEMISNATSQIESQIIEKGGNLPTPVVTYTPIPTWTPVPLMTKTPIDESPFFDSISQQTEEAKERRFTKEKIQDVNSYYNVSWNNEFDLLIPLDYNEISSELFDEFYEPNDEAKVTFSGYSNYTDFTGMADISNDTLIDILFVVEMDFYNPEIKQILQNDLSFSVLYTFATRISDAFSDFLAFSAEKTMEYNIIEVRGAFDELNSSGLVFCKNGKMYLILCESNFFSCDDCITVSYMTISNMLRSVNDSNISSDEQLGYINKNSVNIRSAANQNSPKIATVAKNTTVNIIDDTGTGWYKIQFNGLSTGYVRSDLVTRGEAPIKASNEAVDVQKNLSFIDVVGEARNLLFAENATYEISAHDCVNDDTFEWTWEMPCIANDNLYVFLDVTFNSNTLIQWREFGNAVILGGTDDNTRIPINVISSESKPKKGEKHRVVFIVPLGGVQNKKPSSIRIEPALYSGNGKHYDTFIMTFAIKWM